MITLKIWHGPMRATLTLPLREAEIQKALVKAFHTAPFKVTADDVSPEALAMLNGKEIDLDELNFLAKNLDRFTRFGRLYRWSSRQTSKRLLTSPLIWKGTRWCKMSLTWLLWAGNTCSIRWGLCPLPKLINSTSNRQAVTC